MDRIVPLGHIFEAPFKQQKSKYTEFLSFEIGCNRLRPLKDVIQKIFLDKKLKTKKNQKELKWTKIK